MSTHRHFETGNELHSLSTIGYNRNINEMIIIPGQYSKEAIYLPPQPSTSRSPGLYLSYADVGATGRHLQPSSLATRLP